MSNNDYVDYQSNLNETVVQMMTDVVALLAHYGIFEIPASNVMKLLGVAEEEAGNWENAILSIDENGELKITQQDEDNELPNDVGNVTLH
jgi:hypothetical protein